MTTSKIRILFYGDSIFTTDSFESSITKGLSKFKINIKDSSLNVEESFLRPFDLIIIEHSEECDYLETFFRIYSSTPIIVIVPQGSENLLKSALEYPISNFLVADKSGEYLSLIESLVNHTLRKNSPDSQIQRQKLPQEDEKLLAGNKSETDYKQLYSLLRSLTDTVPDMIWAKDMENRFIYTNASICKNLLNAASTFEPLNKDVMFFVDREREAHPENPHWFTFGEECGDSDAITLEKGELSRFKEYGNVFGKNLILDVYKAPLRDSSGNIIGTVGSARDITIHEETKERYRKLFEFSPDPVVVHIDGLLIAANQAAADFIGAEVREDHYGTSIFEYIHEDYREASISRLKAAEFSERTPTLVEEKYVTLDGKIRDVEAISVPIMYGHKKAWMATFRDISERKKAEEEQKRSLKEKNALLSEIFHRTKNNMQVISSIINIRARNHTDSGVRQMFKEITDRIVAMSLAHDRLYKSKDLSAIDFNSYLTHLTNHLRLSYSQKSIRAPISINADNIIVSIDQAVPLGLVINEILANAYKFASPLDDGGEIKLNILREGEHGLIISISADGAYLPFESFTDPLSTVILNGLVTDQLNGTLEYDDSEIAKFTLRIPDIEIERRI